MIKYIANVRAIGAEVNEFLEHGILVLFGEDAPEELAEFAAIHDGTELLSPVVCGDIVWLDTASFRVTCVGEVANTNLETLGHLILKCNGASVPEMPGDLCVERKPIPPLFVGMTIRIESEEEQSSGGKD